MIYRNHAYFEAAPKGFITLGILIALLAILLLGGWKWLLLAIGVAFILGGLHALALEYAKHLCYSLLLRADRWTKR